MARINSGRFTAIILRALLAVLFVPTVIAILTLLQHSFAIYSLAASRIGADGIFHAFFEAMLGDANMHEPNSTAGYIAFGTLFMAVAVIATFFAALWGYREARKTAVTSKTLDFIFRQVHDKDLIEMFDDLRSTRGKYKDQITYREVMTDYMGYKKLIAERKEIPEIRQDYSKIVQVLNYYETWGIGVENQALDDKMLRDWWRSSLVGDFTDLYDFVLGFREHRASPKAYENIERLVRSWTEKNELAVLDQRKREHIPWGHSSDTQMSKSMLRRLFSKSSEPKYITTSGTDDLVEAA